MGDMIIVGPNGKRFKVNAPAGTSVEEIEETFARENGGARGRVVSETETEQFADLKEQYNAFTSTPSGGLADYISDPNNPPLLSEVDLTPRRVVPENPNPIGYGRKVGDLATGAYTGLMGAAGSLVGLGTYVKGLNKLADPAAEFMAGAANYYDEKFLSDFQLSKDRELAATIQAAVQDMPPLPENASIPEKTKYVADYIIGQGGAAGSFIKDNPGQVTNILAQTVPYIFVGGAAGKGVSSGLNLLDNAVSVGGKVKTITSKVAETGARYAGPIGEGLVAAGDVGANTAINQRAQGNYDYEPERLYGLLTAPVTAVVGGLGSRVSGVADVDTLAARAFGAGTKPTDLVNRSLAGRVTKGAAIEGAEELVQGGSEQVFSNLANDEAAYEGVGSSATLGLVAGSTLGAGVNTAAYISDKRSGNSQINSPAVIERAEEEAALQAQAETEANIEADAEAARAKDTARLRREAAQTFTPKSEFVVARTKELAASAKAQNAQLEQDVLNPETEIGQAFEANLDAKEVFDPADIAAEAKSFVEGYQNLGKVSDKAKKAQVEAQVNQEYVAALDNHAVKVAEAKALIEQNPELMTVDATEVNVPDAEVLSIITRMRDPQAEITPVEEAAATPVKKVTKADKLRALAVEKLGEDFEVNNPELSQLLGDSKGTDSKGKKGSKFERMLNRIVKEQAAEQETAAGEANPDTPQASNSAFPDDSEVRTGLKPQQQKVYDAILKSANENTLGDLFSVTFESGDTNTQGETAETLPTSASAVQARRTAQRKILKKAGVKEKTILDVFKTKTAEPSAQDKLKFAGVGGISATKQPLRQSEQVSILEAAGVPSEVITQFTDTAVKRPEKKAPKERGFKVETNNALLKSLSGIANSKSAATATSAVVTKLRKQYGNDGLREMLTQAGVSMGGGIEVADTATANDLLAEGGSATGTVATAGGSQTDGASSKTKAKKKEAETKLMKKAGMSAEDIEAFYRVESAVPELSEAETADAAAVARAEEEASVDAMSSILAQSWDSSASNRSAPLFNDLTMDQKIEWMHYSNAADLSNDIDRFNVLDSQQREMERAATRGTETQNEQVAEPQTEERNEDESSTSVDESEGSGSSAEAVSDADTGPASQETSQETQQVTRVTAEDILAKNPDMTPEQAQNTARITNGLRSRKTKVAETNDATDNEQFTPTVKAALKVETKKRKKIVRPKTTPPKFSMGEAEGNATGTTANNIRAAVKWLIGKDVNWRVNVVSAPDDLIGMVLSKEINIDGLALGDILDRPNAQGVVVTDNDGVTRAFFFSDNILPGGERGAVIHELGSHLGMDNVLTREQIGNAIGKIRSWASGSNTSLEKTISERALARVKSAEAQNAVADKDSEILAYFLEEAVNAGVTPNSDSKSELVKFIRQIWSDFKRALRKLRPANEAALTVQDFVNMARGAARLELATDFHGSTSAFRKANPDYFGLGNNAVGVGFYISEDQEVGATYMMQRMNEREFNGGVLERIDTAVAENEYLNWEAPLSEQPAMVEAFEQLPEEIQTALLQDSRLDSVEKLNGRQFYLGLTQLQLRDQSLQDYIGDTEFNRSNKLERGTTKAMSVTSAFLDANGVKGIKTEIATNSTNPNPMFNKIIFNDKNVVVVGRNDAADVDPNTTTPGTIKFSVPESETDKQVAWVRQNVSPAAGQALTNLKVAAKAPYTATKNLDRVIRDNEAQLPSARKWMNVMLDAEATRNEILGLVESVVNQTRQFSMERKEVINDFIGSSTFYQKWGYDPEFTNDDGSKFEVKIDPIVKRKYDRLTAEEQQAVRDLFSHGRDLQRMMQDIAKDMGVSQFFKFDSKLKGPYAPLKRFGDYVGELKSQALLDAEAAVKESPTTENRKKLEELKSDGDNYVLSFFESLGEAETFTEANKDKFVYAVPSDKRVDFDEARPGGAQAYEKIMGAVNANMAGLDQSSKDAMAKMVRDMYFQTLDASNARLSGARRLNRAGYDKDMIRSFAVNGMAQANLLAQMKHGGDISSALVGIKEETETDPRALTPIYNQIALKFRATMTPRTGMLANWEDSLMKFNSFYMLTSSLGYFVQNTTQPYFAVANIAGEFGWKHAQTWGKLFSGYAVAKKVINTGFLNQVTNVASMGLLGGNSTVELNIDAAPPEIRPLLKQLQSRGLLDVGITEDLRHVNMNAKNIVTRGYEEMTHRLYQSARYVEANNRIASAVAAFRMAQLNPTKLKRLKMTPQEFALRIVQDTQGNFSKLDAPALFDALPKAPLQFRKYQFQMAFLHIDAVTQAYKGADPETKKAGFRKFVSMMGYTGIFGGLAAVPMAGVATSAIQAALSYLDPEDDDELNPDKSLERWIRENVEDERTATLLARGVPAALGWDFSQKLDQADLFMPYNSKYVQVDPSRDGALLFAAQMLLGPTGTMVGNGGNVLDFVERGNLYRAGEYMMPKGLRSYFETMRYAKEGYKTRSDLTVADPTDFDLVDILTNAVGLPSTDINKIKWTRGQQVEIEQWFSGETTRITNGYKRATEDRDRDAQAKYRNEFRELQRGKDRVRPFFNNSRRVLKRQPITNLLKSPRRTKTDQRRLDSITGR
jgi:hypothetical protein